jgi:hypothetical protein
MEIDCTRGKNENQLDSYTIAIVDYVHPNEITKMIPAVFYTHAFWFTFECS